VAARFISPDTGNTLDIITGKQAGIKRTSNPNKYQTEAELSRASQLSTLKSTLRPIKLQRLMLHGTIPLKNAKRSRHSTGKAKNQRCTSIFNLFFQAAPIYANIYQLYAMETQTRCALIFIRAVRRNYRYVIKQ